MNDNNYNIEPEILLKGLNGKLWKTYGKCKALGLIRNNGDEKEFTDKFKNILKRSFIAEAFYNKYMIAVSGTQGVGKTTMMMNLYEIPDGYLPNVIGRGEKAVVMITEKDIDEIKCYTTKVDIENESNFTTNILSKEEMYNGLINPASDVIYYELVVPKRYFPHGECSFILLPGIEDNGTAEDDFTKYVLEQASNTVFVFSSTKLAQEHNMKLMSKVLEEFKYDKPIFALSFSDQDNSGTDELKGSFSEDYNIDEDRIIKVGTDPVVMEEWRQEIIRSINSYSSLQRAGRERQLTNINDMILDDLFTLLDEIDDRIYMNNIKDPSAGEVDKIFNWMADVAIKVKKDLYEEIDKEIRDISKNAIEEVCTKIDKTKKLHRIIYSIDKNRKYINQLNEKIDESWENNDNNKLLSDCIERVNSKRTMFYPPSIIENEKNQRIVDSDDSTVEILSNLMNVESQEVINVGSSIKQEVKKIPYLSNEIIRIQYLRDIGLLKNEDFDVSNEVMGLAPTYGEYNLIDELKYASEKRGAVLKGIGVLMGVDALDGTINVVPAIAESIGLHISSTMATALFGGIGAIGLFVSLRRTLNAREIAEIEYSKEMIKAIGGKYKENTVKLYEDYFDRFNDYLREKLELRYHCEEKDNLVFGIKLFLSDIRSYGRRILENGQDHPFN
ncbi:hypothetical protein SAMN02745751_03131 [Dethiosulfatibacter aminovorans DSM 17477]|uniref:Dynamin family protein n=1 Tax=Dethiosulfatibacter aminovorans DSM 17477 TaxID=1121476 RepID=A0A1M6LBU9_9FIRM|nr:hypothetical protein [Dethiosulfatibacter aminovorans]SHJ68639.1 hypothetical protein SAMN02745751_03131 [Dethiosulfatibacter aminovorans DSM 17477]